MDFTKAKTLTAQMVMKASEYGGSAVSRWIQAHAIKMHQCHAELAHEFETALKAERDAYATLRTRRFVSAALFLDRQVSGLLSGIRAGRALVSRVKTLLRRPR